MNNGKVLMIIHNRFQQDNFINLGLAYIGSSLLQQNISVEIYDMAVYNLNNEDIIQYLKENSFDLILVSFLSGRFIQTVYPLCKVINEYKKDAWLCLGGHGASPMPQYMIEKTNCEIVCLGEGEEVYPEILECKLNGKSLYDVKGIAFKDKNNIIINEHRRPIIKLDTIQFPSWDLFDMNIYTNNIKLSGMNEKDKCFALISSRGCTNRCSFCYRMENGIRIRSIDNVIEEIKILNNKYGITYFFFFDELFVYTKKRIIEFAKALEKNNLNIMYSVNCRVDVFDEEIARILKDTGCKLNNIGFESTSQEVLDTMGKQVKVEQNYKAAEICKKIGLGMGLNTLWGLPKDSIQTLENNAKFIKEFNLYDQCRIVKPVTPYPGTPLLTEAVKRNFIKKEEEFFDYFKNSDLITFNYMDIPLEEAYQALFAINSDLIIDHYKHTNNNMKKAKELIEGLRQLYFENKYDFYGVRSDTTNEDKRK